MKPSMKLIEQGICFQCELPAMPRCYSDAGRREFRISGLCEKCFDGLFAEEEPIDYSPDEDTIVFNDESDEVAF